MNILLHICCAPCALYTVDKLRQDGHKVEGFFYNPNIAPLAEYKLRRSAVQEMSKRMNLKVAYLEQLSRPDASQDRSADSCGRPHSAEIFASPTIVGEPSRKNFRTSCSTSCLVTAKERCMNCWFNRMSQVSEAAHKENFDAFSTTLLISPYQDHETLKGLGYKLAEEKKVDFYYDDFRAGFRKSQEMARAEGYYRQKYCGCEPSIVEAQNLKRPSASLGTGKAQN